MWGACCAMAAACLFCARPAYAQEAKYDFQIQQESLGAALSELSRQAHVELLYPYQLARVRGNPIKGRYTVPEALDLLLEGTGFSGGLTSQGIVTISLRRKGCNEEGKAMLPDSKSTVSAIALLAGILSAPACHAQAGGAPASSSDVSESIETVTVVGYRASLASSTNAKRDSVGFSESVFSEDIGKFPDTNIAESFNRIPGITIIREVNGEGLQVAIRGLGVNFTKTLLNGAPVAMASTGRTDAQSTNREVDLNMFPAELFTQLTVSKSPTADMIEGGAAGVVNMRSMRPFDNPGMHVTYAMQGQIGSVAGKLGEKGTLIVSNTWGQFGALVGVTVNHSLVRTTGFEASNWTNPKLTAAQCGSSSGCNSTGGGIISIPATVPDTAASIAAGLVPGQVIDKAWLLAHNPGLTIEQIDNGLLPRIARPSDNWGARDRANAVASLEYRPTDDLHFFFDFIGGRLVNNERRTDMMLRLTGTPSYLPLNEQVDANNVMTSVDIVNNQFFLEDRPYTEKEDFISFNPGMMWQLTDLLKVDLQANATRSHFFRDYPSLYAFTARTTSHISNPPGAQFPTFTSPMDLNDPANWGWLPGGSGVHIQQETRYIYTNGARL
ncbi:MAG TPA: TonB-dependent receptor plug domain-containing protein, partial [Rhizomicrobium sp.]